MRKAEKTLDSWVLENVETLEVSLVRQLFLTRSICVDLGLPQRDFEYIWNRVIKDGSAFLTKVLPALGKHFEACLEEGTYTSFHGISHFKGYPTFLNNEFREVFSTTTKPSEQAAISVRSIRQLCYFFYKMQPSGQIPLSEERAAIKKYVELENSLQTMFEWDPLLGTCNLLAKELFGSFDWDDLKAGHGPGSVADMPYARKFDSVKNHALSTPQYLMFSNMDHMVAEIGNIGARTHTEFFRTGSCSEFLCVPKDSRGPRTICREPAAQQVAQQGIRRFMEKQMQSHPLTKGKINFADQSVNGDLARSSSRTQKFATLDLSDASDRLTLALFSKIFSGTKIGQAILDTRSDRVRFPDGHEMALRKLSPMGSAVCFTTLSFTIWSLLYAGFSLIGRDDLCQDVHVYGDDIIVPADAYGASIKILETYGLKVNASKSFCSSWFRESCGVDAYDGLDVTPVRLRYTPEPEHLKNPSNRIPSFAATVHQLWYKGLFDTAKCLASFLPDLPPGDVDCGYISLPEELLGQTIDQYIRGRDFVVKLDGCGRPYSKIPVYRVVEDRAKVGESEISYFWRVIYPSIGAGLPVQTSKYFGEVVLPKRTRLARRYAKVYLTKA